MNWLTPKMNKPERAQTPKTSQQHVRFNLLVLCLVVTFAAIGAAYFIDFSVRELETQKNDLATEFRLEKIVAGQKLSVPQSWLTYPDQMNEGFVERLDLTLPIKFSQALDVNTVNVTFFPRSRLKLSANLLDSVYLHRFTQTGPKGSSGLIGKELAQEAGYRGETVWFDPISANPFVSKCDSAETAVSTPKCLRTVELSSGIGMTMVFDANSLMLWREIDPALNDALQILGAGTIN